MDKMKDKADKGDGAAEDKPADEKPAEDKPAEGGDTAPTGEAPTTRRQKKLARSGP